MNRLRTGKIDLTSEQRPSEISYSITAIHYEPTTLWGLQSFRDKSLNAKLVTVFF